MEAASCSSRFEKFGSDDSTCCPSATLIDGYCHYSQSEMRLHSMFGVSHVQRHVSGVGTFLESFLALESCWKVGV